MNDTELDEMLNQWDAPPAPASLREKVRAGLSLGRKSSGKRWFNLPSWHSGKGLLAGMAAGAVVFLFVIAQAFPQALGSSSPVRRFPYVVESNVVNYGDNGSPHMAAHLFSSSYKGTEIVIAEDYPSYSVHELFMSFHIVIHNLLLRYTPDLVMPESAAKDAWFSAYLQAGCVDKGDNVIGHETILKHATTAVQHIDPDGWRGTVWRAPDLGCFELRRKGEAPMTGGGFRLVSERDATRVLQRDGQPWRAE